MNIDQFQQRLAELSPSTFENLIAEILRFGHRFSEINQNVITGGIEIDIVAKEKEAGLIGPETWLIEVKSAKIAGADMVRSLAARMNELSVHFPPPVRVLLVVAGATTKSAQIAVVNLGIEVWDSLDIALACPPEVSIKFFGEPITTPRSTKRGSASESFMEGLASIPPGHGGFVAYQDLVSKIFTHLFCPPLESPRYEFYDDDEKNRRDMIFENSAPEGFWARLRSTYNAHYIVVDAKNHENEISKDEAIRLAHYLKPYGCGMFGILVCRKGASDACRHAIKEQWLGAQKMLLVVTNENLMDMLRFKETAGRPEEVIRSLIAEFRMRL